MITSELTQYHTAFNTGYWATEDAGECPCRGYGWALSDVDTWHECPAHFTGQRHPDVDEAEYEAGKAEEQAAAEERFLATDLAEGRAFSVQDEPPASDDILF